MKYGVWVRHSRRAFTDDDRRTRKIVKWFMGNDWPVIRFWHKQHNLVLIAGKWLKHRCHQFQHNFNWLRAIYLCILHTHTRPQCGSNVCKSVLLSGLFDNCASFDISQMLRGSGEYLISYLCPSLSFGLTNIFIKMLLLSSGNGHCGRRTSFCCRIRANDMFTREKKPKQQQKVRMKLNEIRARNDSTPSSMSRMYNSFFFSFVFAVFFFEEFIFQIRFS